MLIKVDFVFSISKKEITQYYYLNKIRFTNLTVTLVIFKIDLLLFFFFWYQVFL